MPERAHPIIVIPSRMASTRLPGKPLLDIAGTPMILRVLRGAMEAGIGPVVVACAEQAVADAVRAGGGASVLTDPDLPSGSDRVRAALEVFDPRAKYNVVINLQGDLPLLPPGLLRDILLPLAEPQVDIATLVCPIRENREREDPNVVKAVIGLAEEKRIGRVLYFTRNPAPGGDGPMYHHIGIYAYRRAALEAFAALPPGVLESREKLEQLRALENGMRIDAALVDSPTPGVDTPEDLERVRNILVNAS